LQCGFYFPEPPSCLPVCGCAGHPPISSFFLILLSEELQERPPWHCPNPWNEAASVSRERCLRARRMRHPLTRSRSGKSPFVISSSITGSLYLTSCGCWTKSTNTLSASSSSRDLSMSDARILEKVLRLSRRARYSGGARSDHEDLGKGWTSPTPRLPSVSFSSSGRTPRYFVILPLHEASGDRKARTPFEKNDESCRIGCYRRRLSPCVGQLDSEFETNRPNDISACAVALSVAARVEKWRMLWK
jgi:hypothetical protein